MGEDSEVQILGRKLHELLEKLGEIEIEGVEITAEELTLIFQPTLTAAVRPPVEAAAPKPEAVTQLMEASFTPPIHQYQGQVVEVQLGATKAEGGSRGKVLKVGGEKYPPLYGFEGLNPHRPVFAIDIFDMPLTLAKPVRQHYEDVMDDPGEWAKKCVEEFGADMVDLNLVSTDPGLKDASPREATKVVEEVLQAVDVPLMIGGSGNKQKDPLVLEAAAEAAHGERCIINGAMLDIDYKRVAEAVKKHGHVVLSFTSMDINNQKKLNRLLLDEGLTPEQIVMDPTTAALGYGLEYTFSFMERMRQAALKGDPELQMPLVGPVSNAWGAREAWLKIEDWGPREVRGPLWEVVTATTLLSAGCDIFLMSHPAALLVMKQLVECFWGERKAEQNIENWITALG
ncbi:CO dehydrogenase/acetyl-CoA synthase subunit delta [Candidatus Hecatella orcuttiae]|jgi:acetyl-CoA decarbonylase/synthase complex subunit delta|uniref:CO dehydrogenase/acetyl-CoA synthase subunit delta n=1 Tax=Candidatus Hecatella orcuttiae TaxID=1935119 RepID=UPI00286822A2|nr:CO dehydrogenase/acetyl-CoA synthase subunit delta [Candidatus Hecatella orcuttiae]